MDCAPTSEIAHSGSHSLAVQFEVPEHGWATCGIYFDSVQDWRNFQGITFNLRADRAGLPYDVAVYGGAPTVQTTYFIRMETPPGSESDWIPVVIRWEEFLRAAWEENPGMPFPPAEVTGFSIGLSDTTAETVGGTLWVDTLSLVDASAAAPSPQVPAEATLTPEILESLHGVEQNPNDPYAHLRLSLAYWDAGQPRRAYEALSKGAELAGRDQDYFLKAADEFAKREAWVAAASMYQRSILSQSGGETPEALLNSYHEAVYRASASEELPLYLPFDSIAKVDQPIAFIAEGRYNLHRGDNALAREFLERARRSKPAMPEVTLLDAEIYIKEGRKPEARQLLNTLMASLDTPEWIRAFADKYLLQNP